MKIVRGDGREFGDEDVQRVLRELYSPPVDESYWNALERRIVAAVGRETPSEWWSHFPGWVKLGVSVAAAAMLVASIASWHTRAAQDRLTAQRAFDNAQELPLLSETLSGERDTQREATLRYLITHD